MGEYTGHVKVYRDATRIDVLSHYTEFPAKGGGPRGKVDPNFSPQSRKRLFNLLNSIKQDAIKKALFITLTYERQYVDNDQIKRHLKAYFQATRRNYPDVSAIWKLEFQRRGSPHFHVIAFGRYISHDWVATTWNRIAEASSPNHLKAGTEVRRVRGRKSCYAYVGKYLGKLEDGQRAGDYGRLWGVHNRPRLPVSDVEIFACRDDDARQIITESGRQIGLKNTDQVGGINLYFGSNDDLKEWKRNNQKITRRKEP